MKTFSSNRLNSNPRRCKSLLMHLRFSLALFLGATIPAFAQLQWSTYDTATGTLLAANSGNGGDLASSTSVTFTIPAGSNWTFVTKSFTPFSIAGASTKKVVTLNFSVSGGLTGVTTRNMGWGLYNSASTSGFSDDVGYFGLWNGGSSFIETYDHPAGTANLMSGTKLGQGTVNIGTPIDGNTYTNQIQLDMNSSATGISLGTSSSTLAAAGLAMNGVNGVNSVTHRVYTNPVNPLLGGANSFDEFAFMFFNTTANPITLTLSAITLGNSLTWDASGSNPAAPTDGSGNWTTTNANWSSGSPDTVWSSGYSAVFGANNGAAGVITNVNGVVVSNLTFNAATSGSYNIVSNTIIFTNTPTVTVASGVSATNSSAIGGTGFTKTGNGTFVLLPSVAATNIGPTVVNAGALFLASTAANSLNDNVAVNPGATLLTPSSVGINPASTLTINGGTVTNMGLNGTPTETHNLVVFDNNGVLAYGPVGSAQLNITNFDFRSGLEAFPKFAAAQATNFSVKSTPGTMAVQSRPNNSGTQGLILTVLAGTMILDYPNPSPNGDSTQGGQKLMNSAPLTLGGGTLFGRFNAAATRTETLPSTIIRPGATAFWITNNAPTGGAYKINQGALNRLGGGTVNYRVGGTSSGGESLTTSSGNVNGILGGWATWAESDWATGTGSVSPFTVGAYSAYTTSIDPTTWAPTNNVSLGSAVEVPAGTNINSLKLTAGSTLTLDGNLTLSSGGLLITGSAAPTITGGTLLGSTGGDLIVQQYSSGDLTIASSLADNGSATSLTKSGNGKLIITGTDSMTGSNFLNGGTVEVSDLSKLAAGPIVMNNGTLRYTGSDVASSRSVVLAGVGGTFDVEGSATVTQSAALVSSGGATGTGVNGVALNLGDWSGLTKVGNGTLELAGNNVYNGPTVISNGVLAVNGVQSLTGTSATTNYTGGGTYAVYGGTLTGTGTIPGLVTVNGGGTISPSGLGTLTLNSGLTLASGSTCLFTEQNGSSGGLLQVQGNLSIQPNSTIAVNISGAALNPATNTIITYTGTRSGLFNPTVVVTGGSLNSSISLDQNTPGQIRLLSLPQVAITQQPTNVIVSTNDPVTFSVTATGSAPLYYQWYYTPNVSTMPSAIPGANASSYMIANADGTNNGLYSVVITNSYNSVTSTEATLIVGNVCSQLSGPTDQTVIQGNNASFAAIVVLANPQPALQWQTNGVNVPGATGTSLTLNNVQYALNGTTVSLIASNAACIVTNNATLTVIVTPVITTQPTNLTVNVGDTATFVSGASGIPAPTYQWYKNNAVMPGQTASTLTINNAQGSDIAGYKLVATNAAGSATSTVATLTVNSTTLAATALAPANGATGVCYDTPLYVTFNGPISQVSSGKIRIFNATNPATPVDILDMSSNVVVISTLNSSNPRVTATNSIQPHSLFSGDSQVINYQPVIITGTTAAIYPHGGVMTSNQTYYVTLDNGIVSDNNGAYFAGISDTNAWRFSTKPTGPANPTSMVVAADGSGDFVTVQGAVDSVTPGNTNFTLVNIRSGNYVEIVDISGKNNITFRGQTRTGTLVGYPNNNNFTGTTAARMAFKVNSADIKLENLTITNGTPQGGSQAEALLIYNNGVRCVVNNCDIVSRQDTILINANTSQGYFYNCRVVGNFDYIWGVGVGYFDHCTFHTLTNIYSASYNLTAARTQTSSTYSTNTPWATPVGGQYSADGFSFVSSRFEADTGVTGITVAGQNGTSGGLDSWALSTFDATAYATNAASVVTLSNVAPLGYTFWQYSNTDLLGNPISFAGLQTIGVTNNDPRLIAATNPVIWFYGWIPQIAPNILTNPANENVPGLGTISLAAFATGIPTPSYQWFKDGNPLNGQTAPTLTIPNANANNTGNYSVVVSNIAGVVTSTLANVVVSNTAPTLAAIPSTTNNVGVTVSVTPSATDPDVPAQTLTFSLLSGPFTTFNTNSGAYTWRPEVTDSGTLNTIQIAVTDNGSPNLSATQSFVVAVNPLTQPTVSAPAYAVGQFTLSVDGQTGPDYEVLGSTNLTDWVSLVTNTSPTMPFLFTDPNASTYPTRFYRIVVGPPPR
jgi:autotransporter-associated beta strand protein